ncbi:MAG: hypothetical protein B7Y25_03480 [Alphaproteobacteria bacterium 16-39-46]|nr:MAG: hypothetical protein B7Y25_03480 [Alphaproteobacteria bacterium 16-39-46]OZA43319.1 MAG: hypothetical protein B7X84_03480 [Alphaproteobacteria bacterium 17-39-52]HQS83923.1 hypothetical protein [Alphaproteobacteria bacterium]HQS93791.1 hypothetical protein [Alphaproteobacteria bacterium]
MEHASKNHLWAQNYLSSNGYECDGQGQTVRERPWARITCFKTLKGLVYLKSMAPGFENEPIVVQFIRDHISKKVPDMVASNHELSCFLMKDAGVPLRDILNEKFNSKLFCQAIKVCSQIQIGPKFPKHL